MKKLLKNIVSSILLIFFLIMPIYAEEMVPIEQFNEVYDQLVISNNMVKELKSSLDLSIQAYDEYKDFTEEEIKNLKVYIDTLENDKIELQNQIDTKETEKSEILGQLIISNEENKKQHQEIKDLTLLLDEAKKRLEESNLLIEKNKTFSIGVFATNVNFDFGGGIDFSYFLFKGLTIDTGVSYIHPKKISFKLGLSYLW